MHLRREMLAARDRVQDAGRQWCACSFRCSELSVCTGSAAIAEASVAISSRALTNTLTAEMPAVEMPAVETLAVETLVVEMRAAEMRAVEMPAAVVAGRRPTRVACRSVPRA